MTKPLDKIDAKIIGLLQTNGRMPNTEIARKAKISEATVRNRMDRLIEEDYIKVVAVADPFKLGFTVVGNLKISVNIEMAEHVGNELKKLKEIWYVGQMTGVSDFDVEFIVRSLNEFHNLLLKKIHKIRGVIRTETSFVLRHFKHSYDWGTPLD